ncbi:MAG: hypothetical protein K8R55_01055 [Desulfuromonadaceae bacterium]|nr:hypothetical protein [Desulfuromonadaceae bacterium]
MKCPKCGYDNQLDREDCFRCRVIFAKVRQEPDLTEPHPQELVRPEEASETPQTLESVWKAAALLVMGIWGGKLIFAGIAGNSTGNSWLHLVNLPFHEAGHLFFRPLGGFMTSLGGTLGQLLVPLVCMATLLLKTRDPFGGAVCLWWLGESFLDIAPYINDARAGRLPLLGGNFGHSSPYGFHDWEYLLTETGLLRFDHALAKFAHGFGTLLMTLALAWGVWLLVAGYQKREMP